MTPDQRARLERLARSGVSGDVKAALAKIDEQKAHIDALEARVGELTRERDVALTQAAQDYGEWEMASARAEQAEARVRELEILMVREGEA
jgi:hypothetical protein